MKLPKPYAAIMFNWNQQKRSVDIIFFSLKNKNERNVLSHTRLRFVYEKDRMRVYKYLKLGRSTSVYIRPGFATENLRDADYLLIPDTDLPWDNNGLIEYCSTFKISTPKIAQLCWNCLFKRDKWTVLDTDSIKYKGHRICDYCSKTELTTELQRSNLYVSGGLTKFFQQQAQREGHLDNVLENISFGSDQDPIRRPDSTLFDIIPGKKVEKGTKVNSIDQLPRDFKQILVKDGIATLLPVQELAIERGLLRNKDMLVVAGTTSGKTLVGELAGIPKAMKGNKLVYLSPLVALTNQKYEQFKKRYKQLNLKTAIRVGMSRIKVEGEFKPIIDENFRNAHIVVATYEAFDFLLRDSKRNDLGDIGTIVIDEVQMLVAEERGFRLNGLIARLKALFPKAQYIYLSATIGNPKGLAEELSSECVEYLDRPIPLERHTVLTESEIERFEHIKNICKFEEGYKSKSGYRGQSLVFTNSRKNCEALSKKLKRNGVNSTFYHAGLTYTHRKRVEKGFEKGRYSTVVTTIALGAGVDFPASAVIFENLAMGIKWLSVAEFHQMLGRAGRFGFHDKGKVYLLVEPGRKIFVGQRETEEQIAFGSVDILDDKMIFVNILGRSNPLRESVKSLRKMGMITIDNKIIAPTNLGRAVSLSFLSPAYALRIVQDIERKKHKRFEEDFALTLAIKIQPFRSAHLAPRVHGDIERILRSTISTNIFSGVILDLYTGNGWGRNNPSKLVIDTFSNWAQNIFTCKCGDKPFCECGEITLSKIIVELRGKGYSPSRISDELRKNHNILTYPGDIYSWLDSLVHHLNAIERLAKVLEEPNLQKLAVAFTKDIENPKTE
ncbi:DEAD/DEAH box helicase [Candidatus Heimdallarchaeota archaeon]|nr:MAG: DEAD/DEAH box helicase [Candidatus Heimdallarchaeota archaeon]